MKSPFFILFLIINLLSINMVSASNSYDDNKTDLHLVSNHHDNELSPTDTEHDESACSHLCHISSHMVGLISQIITSSIIRDSVSYTTFQRPFRSFIHTPPSQPPKA